MILRSRLEANIKYVVTTSYSAIKMGFLDKIDNAASSRREEGVNSGNRARRTTPSSIHWPKRYQFPAIADILEYRSDLGSDATPDEIASVAAGYFNWSNELLGTFAFVRVRVRE